MPTNISITSECKSLTMVTENDDHHGDCPKDNEKNEQEHRDVARVVRAGDGS